MDQYAPYVFSAYGVALSLLAATAAAVLFRVVSARRKLSALQAKSDGEPPD